jgi:hypothetical protein
LTPAAAAFLLSRGSRFAIPSSASCCPFAD